MARAPPGVRGSAGDGDGPRVGACGVTKALRGRCSSVKALPNHALTARHGAEGRYPRRGSSTPCGAGVGDARRSNAQRGVVASREACDDGIRRVCSDWSGRRSNRHAPRVPRYPREREAPNVRLRNRSRWCTSASLHAGHGHTRPATEARAVTARSGELPPGEPRPRCKVSG